MGIYIVTCDKLNFFKTFDSLDSVIDYLNDKNKAEFSGEIFSLFGRPLKEVWYGDYSEFMDDNYFVDSVLLSHKDRRNEYYTFFIRCIDSEGNQIELE